MFVRQNSSGLFKKIFLVLVLCSCQKPNESSAQKATTESPTKWRIVQKTVEAMGTLFNFTIATTLSDRSIEKASNAAFDEIKRIESMMSSYSESSIISKINRSAGKSPVKAPRELFELVEQAIQISKRTQGKFDITFGPLGKLWNFRKNPPQLPDPALIKSKRELVDYRLIRLDRVAQSIFLPKQGMSIGLGAIAKGYGVDCAAKMLKKHGINDFIVYGGGDIYFSGTKGGKPWRVGIQDPRDRENYFADFSVTSSGAVVTSGDYEKFFVKEGRRYHHIIDPKTGYCANESVSVTIVTEHATDADALATGIFILGAKKGMAMIESDPKIEGVIVDANFDVHVSSGLKKDINLTPITGKEDLP